MSPAPLRALPWLLLAAGVAGLALRQQRAADEPATLEGEGRFWSATAAGGAPLPLDPGPESPEPDALLLPEGAVFRFSAEDEQLHRYDGIGLELQLLEGATAELRLREREGSAFVVGITRSPDGASLEAKVRLLQPGQQPRPIAACDMRADTAAPFFVALRAQPGTLAFVLADAPRLEWSDAGLASGAHAVVARGGAVRLLGVSASGSETNQRGNKRPFREQEEFRAQQDGSAGRPMAIATGLGAAALLLATLLLAALCDARPGVRAAVSAAALLLAPVGLLLAIAAFIELPLLPALLGAAALCGLPLALHRLGPALHAERVALRRVAALLAFLALAGAAGWLAASRRHADLAPRLEREAVAIGNPLPRPFRAPGQQSLDAGNALTVGGSWRDFDLTVKVDLAEGAALGVRLRAPDPAVARGILCVLSDDPRLPSGFVREDFAELAAVGERFARSAEGELRLESRGRVFRALLDGEEIARVEDPLFAAGGIVLLALTGEVGVSQVSVEPVAPSDAPPSPALPVAASALALPLLVLLMSALGALLLRRPFGAQLAATSFALVAVAAGLLVAREQGVLDSQLLLVMTVATGALAALPALVHARGRPLAALLLAGTAAAGAWGALRLSVEEESIVDTALLNRMSYLDWEGEALHEDLLWLQHPLLRRWNDYHAQHLFRGKRFELEKPGGVRRVVALGGSGTWGFKIPYDSGMDWPSLLEGLLAKDAQVEVINAAYMGATGGRLLRLLRDALLRFEPDVVVLSIGFNDGFAQSQGDEEGYLARAAAPGFERGWLSELRARRQRDTERAALAGLLAAHGPAIADGARLWTEAGMTSSPPARFLALLRRYAALCAEHGIALVFVKEPTAGDEPRIWKSDFGAAMDQVAAESGALVVDPAPALQAAGGAALFMDQVHPKPAGNQVIARVVEPAVRQALQGR